MLPIDSLTKQAKEAYAAHGVEEEAILACVKLDLDRDGNYGEGWLALDGPGKRLVCLSSPKHVSDEKAGLTGAEFRDFTAYDLSHTYGFYVDNYVASNRLMALDGEPYVEDPDVPPTEREKAFYQHRLKSTTIPIACCTNGAKKKLFAFLDILGRFSRGDVPDEDDPLFEQFNAKCPKCGRVYKDQTRRICEYCANDRAVFRRLLKYFKYFKVELCVVLACMFLSSGVALVTPLVNGKLLFDQIISKPNAEGTLGRFHTEGWVWIAIGMLLGLNLLALLLSVLQNRTNAVMSNRVTLRMKMDVFTAMQRLSLSFYNNNQTGRLITRVNYDADRVRSFFIDGVPNLIFNGLNFIGLTIFLFIMNWRLTLIVFIPVPIIVCIFKFALPKLWRMYSKQWRASSTLNGVLGDTLNGIRVVKAFAKETEEADRFRGYSEKLYKTSLQVNMTSLTIFPIIGLLIGLSSQAIWGFGGLDVMNRYMTYGEFTAYFGYLGMIFGPLNFFTNFVNIVTDTLNASGRMFEILDAVPEINDAPDAVSFDRFRGEIEFKKVNFHYTANRPILKNVSFHIEPGAQVGLVGHTGSGKSTIANLINRLYDVVSGSIEIDGVDVKKIKTESLRRNIAIVSQEIFIFKGTVADNIRYAVPDAPLEKVIECAKAANAHDYIMSLPDGYQTVVGTGARRLSGGERQRISIARALLLDPSILILDEATAAMDTETERLIQDALTNLCKGRTTITIAHRLSTLRDCTYLMAIEHGEIAERGTHDELLKKKGIFYRLYTLQMDSMKRVLQGM